MYSKAILLLSLAGAALAEPIPQAAPSSFDLGGELSSAFAAIPTDDPSLTSLLGPLNIYSDMPTPPAEIGSIIASAATAATDVDPCATTEPAWVKNLPASVKSALTSYESAIQSWYSVHSTDFPDYTVTGALPTYTGGDACAAQTGSSPKNTGAATTGAGAGSTSKGAAASGTNSPGAAAPTGAIAVGLAGVAGVVGLMVAL